MIKVVVSFFFFSFFLFANEKLYTCSIKKVNLFSSSRACVSEFISKNSDYHSDDLEIKINKDVNTIDIFGDKIHSLSGNIALSFFGDEISNVSLGYANIILGYSTWTKENIMIEYMSLGYDVSYNTNFLSYYAIPHVGVSNYKIFIQKDGFFVAIKTGIRKEIFNTKVSIFGNFQKDFIDDLSLNSMSFGVSFGF